MARYENDEEGKLYRPIASRTIWRFATHYQRYKTLLDVSIWNFLEPNPLLKTSCSDTTFVTSGEHPLDVTRRTWSLGVIIQAHSYHSSHRHSKFSEKIVTFHSTSYARKITSYIYKIQVIIHIETLSLFHIVESTTFEYIRHTTLKNTLHTYRIWRHFTIKT